MPTLPGLASELSGAPAPAGWRLEQSYTRLPAALFVRLAPEPVSAPRVTVLNRALVLELGLDAEGLSREAGAAVLGGNALPPGADPIAQAYAGHQFGHFTTLGDGRAILLGEQVTPEGRRFDIQLKGSGRTPFSRGGDGRAALGPMLREFLISEAMHALGIQTTRSLAVTTTGEKVHRQESLPGAVLCRVASSHIRVGTFEWAAAHGDPEVLSRLVDYTLARHYPEEAGSRAPGLALLEAVIDRQACLIAQWQSIGFVHGVMNTDNMALSGETIDYGPCAFMDRYDPATVFSSIDRLGRYAYGHQPTIAQWNLARLAEALLPAVDPDPQRALDLATAAVYSFPERFHQRGLERFTAKLGIVSPQAGDQALVDDLLKWMHHQKADFTNTFVGLTTGTPLDGQEQVEFSQWWQQWQDRLAGQEQPAAAAVERMRASNPAVIPRNHRVEAALEAAERREDLHELHQCLDAFQRPFEHGRHAPEFTQPAEADSPPYRTFCGT